MKLKYAKNKSAAYFQKMHFSSFPGFLRKRPKKCFELTIFPCVIGKRGEESRPQFLSLMGHP